MCADSWPPCLSRTDSYGFRTPNYAGEVYVGSSEPGTSGVKEEREVKLQDSAFNCRKEIVSFFGNMRDKEGRESHRVFIKRQPSSLDCCHLWDSATFKTTASWDKR